MDVFTNTTVDEINDVIDEMSTTAEDVNADAAIALAAKEYVSATYNAALWASGTTYDQCDGSIGSNGYTYISMQDSNTNHDPTTDDGTWWKRTNGPWPHAAGSQSSSSNITLSATDARMQRITMTAATKTIALPDAQNLEIGPMFIFWNEGEHDFILTDYAGNNLWVVEAGGSMVTAYLMDVSTQAGIWNFGPGTSERIMPETPVVFSMIPNSQRSSIVNIDDSVAICAVFSTTTSYGSAYAIDLDDGSVLDGPVTFDSNPPYDIVGEKLSNSEAAFAYRSGLSGNLSIVVFEYDSGTLSLSGGPTTTTTPSVGSNFSMCVLSSSEIAVAYSDSSNDLDAAIFGWNGTTLSVSGSATQISSSDHENLSCVKIDSSNFLIFALIGALMATLAELSTIPINDNLKIPLFSGLGMYLVMYIF